MFEVQMQKDVVRKWFFRIKSGNGCVLCHSRSYSSKTACYRTASKVQANLKHSGKKVVEV